MRILLCEDDAAYAEAFEALFDAHDPESVVHQCSTLRAGIDLLEGGYVPDVIVVDLSLPDAQGTEALHVMLGATPGVPVAVLTGYDMFREESLRMGAQAYLIKASLEGIDLVTSIRTTMLKAPGQRQGTPQQQLSELMLTQGALSQQLRLLNQTMSVQHQTVDTQLQTMRVLLTGDDGLAAQVAHIAVAYRWWQRLVSWSILLAMVVTLFIVGLIVYWHWSTLHPWQWV